YRLVLADRQPRAEPLALPGVTGRNKQPDLARRFRRQVPDDTPAFVPRERDGLALFVADPAPGGWLAFYKGRCGGLGDVCAYRAALFDTTGATAWALDLNVFFSLDRHVEVQDVRLHAGKLYFNEACQSYAREAGGNARRSCASTRRRARSTGARRRSRRTTCSSCTTPTSSPATASPTSPTRSIWSTRPPAPSPSALALIRHT